jgi:ribonuclease P protein component
MIAPVIDLTHASSTAMSDVVIERATFPRIARVRARSEFTKVFDNNRRFSHPLLSLHWLEDAQPARLGLAVSRKVDPHAVGRNRIKRVLRDSFRRLRLQLPAGAYVVVARPAAAQVENVALRAAFFSVLQRAGALPVAVPPGTMPTVAVAAATTLTSLASPMPRPRAG